MKADLFTSVAVFAVGVIVAFIACNMFLPEIKSFNIKTVNIDSSASLTEPDIEVFNYRAINPTVEVYVGEGCEIYDEDGKCVGNDIIESEENKENNKENNEENQEENNEENTPEENNNGPTD